MLAKQFWRISHNPQSLVDKTFKAEYIPGCSIHNCEPKPHHLVLEEHHQAGKSKASRGQMVGWKKIGDSP